MNVPFSQQYTTGLYSFLFAAIYVKTQAYRQEYAFALLPRHPTPMKPLGRREAVVNCEAGSEPGAKAATPR